MSSNLNITWQYPCFYSAEWVNKHISFMQTKGAAKRTCQKDYRDEWQVSVWQLSAGNMT